MPHSNESHIGRHDHSLGSTCQPHQNAIQFCTTPGRWITKISSERNNLAITKSDQHWRSHHPTSSKELGPWSVDRFADDWTVKAEVFNILMAVPGSVATTAPGGHRQVCRAAREGCKSAYLVNCNCEAVFSSFLFLVFLFLVVFPRWHRCMQSKTMESSADESVLAGEPLGKAWVLKQFDENPRLHRMLSPPVVDRLTNQALDVPYASDLVPPQHPLLPPHR